ncbi:MAG: hypothetical protein KDK07_20630 [Bauldia sp.]|nr:hypothetical protein [Bauldia sp.]
MSNRPNHPSLDDIRTMPIGDIAALPADQLALLQDEAEVALQAAKAAVDWLTGAFTLRFAERAQSLRLEAGKDAGTVRFEDGPVTVTADLPKKVDWDQAILAGLIERIRAAGDDPADYVDVSYKVPERKFAAWPVPIRKRFVAARTVRTGKPTFTLTLNQNR